jgi:hypothetical protein
MKKRMNTGFTLDQQTVASLKAYCAANDKFASAVVERAILSYLKSQGYSPPTEEAKQLAERV